MDDLLILLALLLLVAVLVLPVVSLVVASRARARVLVLEAANEARERELRYLYERLKALESRAAAPVAPAPAPAPPEPEISPPLPGPAPSDDITPVPAVARELPPPKSPSTPPANPPPPASPPPPAPPPPPPLEQRLGTWFARLGAGALIIATLFFFKYAVDNDWVGPAGRVLIGMVTGAAALVAAEILKRSTRAAFVHAVTGLGIACLLVSIYASSAFYDLVPVQAAFAGNALVLLIGAALAWRHKGEPILVLVLIATFLNPVLLSTGEDRPFALFSYLWVVTGLILALATRLRFKFALAIGVIGVLGLFTGWYDRFFDLHDARASAMVDLPAEQLVGAYLRLSARVVPLCFVGLFSGQWIATALALKKGGASSAWTLPLVLSALLFVHAGWTALLFDQAYALGAAMIIAGVAAIVALARFERSDLLLIPMVASFLALSARVGETPSDQQLIMLGILGLWSTLYVLTFLRAASRGLETIEPGAAVRAAVGLALLGVLGAILLLPAERTVPFTVLLLLLGLAVALIADRAHLFALVSGAVLASGLGLSIAAVITRERGEPVDGAFVALIALWALVHGGAVARAALAGRPFRWVDLATLSFAGLGFVMLAIGSTSEDVPTLRALLTAGIGVADLLLAQLLLRRRPELGRMWAVLAAQALGLFAASMAFALTGAGITLAWAALTLVAALILAWAKDPIWGAAVVLLAVATLARVLGADLEDAREAVERWHWSGGRSGIYRLTPIFNARAAALLGSSAAFLAGGLVIARRLKDRTERAPDAHAIAEWHKFLAPALILVAYALALGAAISEAQSFALELPPPPPMPLDQEEMAAFYQTVQEARFLQRGKLAMVSTITLAGFAMSLLGVGFLVKDGFHRWLGLSLFIATIAKLVGWDVWNLARTYQIIVFFVVGALLLGSGFLYARLRALFGAGRTAVWLVALGLAGSAAPARAAPERTPSIERARSMRVIQGVTAAGDHRARIDLALYRASLSEPLFADLRVLGPSGRAAPYLVRFLSPHVEDAPRPGTLFDPAMLPGGGARALFSLPSGAPHCRVSLDLEAEGAFLRRAVIETGKSPSDLAETAAGGLIYTLSNSDHPTVRHHTLRYPQSVAEFVRVTIEPGTDRVPITIRGATFSPCSAEVTPVRERFPLQIAKVSRDEHHRHTVVDLDAGAEGVPIERLVLEVTAPLEYVRAVEVSASSHQAAWPAVASGVIHHVDGQDATSESTTLAIPATRKRWLRIAIADHDDAPLTIAGVSAELRAQELVFRAGEPGEHRVYLGDPEATVPSYDLDQILARRAGGGEPVEITLGALQPNPSFGRAPQDAGLPFTERHRLPIGIALGALLLALSLWAIRLLRQEREG